MKSIIVLGGGGHAKVLISAIESMGLYEIGGILDSRLVVGSEVMGYPILGTDDILLNPERNCNLLAIGVGTSRKGLYEKFLKLNYQFPAVIHKAAVVDTSAVLSPGVQVMAGSVVQPCASIGENTIINTGAVVEHDCVVGNHCHIAPGSVLGGGVHIGAGTLIGLGARVLPGLRIGSGVTIGAGAVVLRDVENSKTLVGNPAVEIEAVHR